MDRLLSVPSNATITIPELGPVKLGCQLTRPTVNKALTSLLADVGAALPDAVNYGRAPGLKKMYLNNRYGICVISDRAHAEDVCHHEDGQPDPQVTDKECADIYFRFSPNDTGCVISQVLEYQRRNGLLLGGKTRKIGGWAPIDTGDRNVIKAAILLFGANPIGFAVTDEWRSTARPGFVWRPSRSPVVGGHDVPLIGYDSVGPLVSTWGMTGTMSWEVFENRGTVTEVYAVLHDSWTGADDKAAALGGKARAKLLEALDAIKRGQIPDIDVTPPGPPTPPAPVPTGRAVFVGTARGKVPGLFASQEITLAMTGTITPEVGPAPSPVSPPPAPPTPEPVPDNDNFRAGFGPDLSVAAPAPAEVGGLFPGLEGIVELIALLREIAPLARQVLEWVKWLRSMSDGGRRTVRQDSELAAVGLGWEDVAKWAPVVLQKIIVVIPVIAAGKAAGKSNWEILRDVIAALTAAGVTV